MVENSFLLIPRGECTFVTKAIHAQELGAQMAIIMDNQTHDRKVIMKDDGYGTVLNNRRVQIEDPFNFHPSRGWRKVGEFALQNRK